MSLLMDALRKAEESRKKAGDRPSDSDELGASAADSKSESTGRQHAAEPEITPTAGPVAEPASKAIAQSEPEPEPEPEPGPESETEHKAGPEAPVAGRRGSGIPDMSLEFSREEDSRAQETAESGKGASRPDIEPASAADTPAESELELTPRDSAAARRPIDVPAATGDVIPQRQRPPAAEVPPTTKEQSPASQTARVAMPEPGQPMRSKIRERTAGSRASARSVFAAKQQGSGKRQRQYAIAGAAVIVLVMLGGGLIVLLGGGSDSGISLPDNYVAGQQTASDGQVDRFEDDVESGSDSAPTSGNTTDQSLANAGADANQPRVTTLAEMPAEEVLEPPVADSTASSQLIDTNATANAAPVQQEVVAPVDPEPESETAVESGAGEQTAVAESSQSDASETDAASGQLGESPPAVARISFTRRQSASEVEPLLLEAYGAYQDGDLSLARQRYQAVLEVSAMHRDALLGLAAIAVAQQQPARAMELYSRLLARNPADPVARAGLLDLSPAGGPATQEMELKRLLAMHPGVATLSYALGNFYASRQQWNDAQQYYFQALQLAKTNATTSDNVNPDYAYNLAVSLEHLNQTRAALSFYEEALMQAQDHQPGFDLDSARRRVESLSRTLSP